MTNTQLWTVIAAPILVNAITITMVYVLLSNRIEALERQVTQRLDALERQMNQRFSDMVELWRAELHRVEEVFDARLKHRS